jgi:hypothetical protein
MSMQASGADRPDFASTEMEAWLHRSLYRFDCPDPHTLGEYELEFLEPEQRTRIAAHASECDHCRAELQTLRAFLTEPTQVPESILDRVRRLVATLVTPASGIAHAGLRGNSTPAVRVYEVEDVTVTIGPGQGPGTLIGLVMATSSPPEVLMGREVRLVPQSGVPRAAALDDIGNFDFEDLVAGTYSLELDLPDSVVVIEELRLH